MILIAVPFGLCIIGFVAKIHDIFDDHAEITVKWMLIFWPYLIMGCNLVFCLMIYIIPIGLVSPMGFLCWIGYEYFESYMRKQRQYKYQLQRWNNGVKTDAEKIRIKNEKEKRAPAVKKNKDAAQQKIDNIIAMNMKLRS